MQNGFPVIFVLCFVSGTIVTMKISGKKTFCIFSKPVRNHKVIIKTKINWLRPRTIKLTKAFSSYFFQFLRFSTKIKLKTKTKMKMKTKKKENEKKTKTNLKKKVIERI